MVLDVNTDFAVGDTLTVSGAEFTAFTAASAADNLELEIDNGGTVADTDDKTITILDGPSIALVKSLLTVSDPINGATNPKAIQGAYIVYTVTATNSGLGASDSDTVVVIDVVPPDTEIFVNDFSGPGTGPIEFIDGATASGLTYTFTSLSSGTDDIEFSDDDGSTYAYTPTADADGFDSSVTNIRVIPKSAFDAASGGDTPSFSLKYQIRVL
jgi:uncharacterized repeat protein (TIGR01451 family)